MNDMFAASKEKRFELSDNISVKTYNLVMGGVILYGLLANYLICAFGMNFVYSMNPVTLLVGYIVCCFAGIIIAHASKNPVVSFIGYNLVVLPLGLVLAITVASYGGVNSAIVKDAALYTTFIVAIMILASLAYPEFFEKLSRVLLISLLAVVIVELVLMFLGASETMTSYIAAGIFSLYIGFDFWRAQKYPKTLDNAVDCALDIYLDIINLFLRILRILSKSRD